MAKILLVEDHLPTAQSIQAFLSRRHKVLCADNLRTARERIHAYPFDLIILDRLLPDGDAFELVEYLHDDFSQLRILILSQQSSPNDQLFGYKLGADDYLPKPFNLEMLSIRVQSQLDKIKIQSPEDSIPWGKLSYYPRKHQLQTSPKRLISFPAHQAIIFEHLLCRLNSIVSREEFIDVLFNRTERHRKIDLRSIDVALRRLRLQLGRYGKYLKCVHGLGYSLTLPSLARAN